MNVERVNVLDKGYVEIVSSWGSDEDIVRAARMSTQKGFQGWGPRVCDGRSRGTTYTATCVGGVLILDGVPEHTGVGECPTCKGKGQLPGDEKLLAYLWKHHHTTPFEMAGATFEVKAPIFVFREWHRHRTQSYNEMSARYAPLPNENYRPTVQRIMQGGGHLTRQAGTVGGANELTQERAMHFAAALDGYYEAVEKFYQASLVDGIPKELARLILPVGRYSKQRASANLFNWIRFLRLRLDETAQWEIRQYARGVAELLTQNFPRTMALFEEERQKGQSA